MRGLLALLVVAVLPIGGLSLVGDWRAALIYLLGLLLGAWFGRID